MKKMMILLVMALVMFTGSAFAADTLNIDVTATVIETCSFTTVGPVALDFGALDPTVAGDTAAANSNVDFTCNNGAGYGVTVAAATGTLTGASLGDTIAYDIVLSGDTNGTSAGGTNTVNVAVDINAGGFFGKAADSYSDSFVLTLNP